MSLTEWNSSLATGDPTIDDQHKQLINTLNALATAYRSGEGRLVVEKTMTFLVEYTIKHFDHEEVLQKKYGYPDYEKHRQIHEDFKRVAGGLLHELKVNGPTDVFISHIYSAVSLWVVQHIKGEDIKMAAFIKSKMQ
jgi:hemerythrin